ncbi:class IIb bacteriocin, lactobin A/cerein 7B family [Natronospora cellulosivora (SeqCode)]
MLKTGMVELTERELYEKTGGAVTLGVMVTISLVSLGVAAVGAAYGQGKKSGYEEVDQQYKLEELKS